MDGVALQQRDRINCEQTTAASIRVRAASPRGIGLGVIDEIIQPAGRRWLA